VWLFPSLTNNKRGIHQNSNFSVWKKYRPKTRSLQTTLYRSNIIFRTIGNKNEKLCYVHRSCCLYTWCTGTSGTYYMKPTGLLHSTNIMGLLICWLNFISVYIMSWCFVVIAYVWNGHNSYCGVE
jgi:hypothetical protein